MGELLFAGVLGTKRSAGVTHLADQTPKWILAQEALKRASSSLSDEFKAMRALRRFALMGEIETRGVIKGKLISLEPLFWGSWENDDGQPATADWTNSRFEGSMRDGWTVTDLLGASKVEFSNSQFEQKFPDAPRKIVRRRGRPNASWWPTFAEELAVYVYQKGVPEGIEELNAKVLDLLSKRGFDNPGRTSIQDVVSKVFHRVRDN